MTRVAVAKWGNSLAIRLPMHVANDLQVGSGSELDLDVRNGQLVARPRAARPRLRDIVRKITKANRHATTDWGTPRGNEVW